VNRMLLSDLVGMLSDFAEIIVMLLLVYVAYKITVLLDALTQKIRKESSSSRGEAS